MKLQDTTNPDVHPNVQTLLSETRSQKALELVSRFRVHPLGVYHAEVGAEWNSRGRKESDFLHHIDLVCSGRREVIHSSTTAVLEPGWAWLLPGCMPVARRCETPGSVYFIKFRCEWLPGVDPLLDWPERQPLRLGRWDEAAFRALWSPTGDPDTRSLFILQAQIHAWLAASLPDLQGIILKHLQTHSRFERVFDLIEHRLGADLRLERLAAAMKMSVPAFSMAFSRSVGLSPKAYLSRRLNQEAIRLLIQAESPVKEVAFKLRFSDEYYFSRFFKKLNGVPPAHYRDKFFGRTARGLLDKSI